VLIQENAIAHRWQYAHLVNGRVDPAISPNAPPQIIYRVNYTHTTTQKRR
jgi:hypothetical protein